MKYLKNISSALLVFCFFSSVFAQTASENNFVSKVWVADNGDGTYKNPILHADFSDPDAVRVGDDFYMTASSFNAAPGLPILHSKDLVNWKLINYVFTRQKPLDVFDIGVNVEARRSLLDSEPASLI